MEVKMKEAVEYIRKHLLFSLKYTFQFACRHPFVASSAFSLFLLYSFYPSLFVFLVSSSPVISCTALLLGILLSYGEPNIPEIEEDDKINREVSFLKVENSEDDLFVEKDENFTLEDLVDNRVGTEERISKDSAPYGENEREIDSLAVELMKEQSESYMRTSEVASSVSEGIEGLIVKIYKPELDDWLDSSLGSPWQPVNIREATSDSESDQAESSSPDASMADILPMLDELSPLLDSKTPHKAPKSADISDSDLSQPHESDEDSVEKEDDYKTEEKDESNKVVTWTADDEKNVMDLGSSDLERNQRLESLIARRRARKNQIIIYEKDLIDLHSNDMKMDELFRIHPQIPPIFAPRSNPFDPPPDLDESKGFPPIPGSAPSILLRRQNPFDFPCDSEDGNKCLAEESLGQPEFVLPSQRGFFFRRQESFSSHSTVSNNLIHEKHGSSRLNPSFFAERIDLEGNEYVDFHSQLSGKIETNSSSVLTSDTVSSAIDQHQQKVPSEQETQEGIPLSVAVHHIKPTEQYSQTYEDDLVYSQLEVGEDDHSIEPIASVVTEETCQGIGASGIVNKIIEEIQIGQNHEAVEEKHDGLTLLSSPEKSEKSLDISLDEVLETHEQITIVSKESSESMQSSDASASHLCETEGVDNNQAALPIYDSSPSGSGNFFVNISVPDDNLLSSVRDDLHSVSSVESHGQEDAMERVSAEMIEFKVVHGSKLQNTRSNSGETVTFSTYMNLLDDNISESMGVSETGEKDFNEISSPGIDEDIGNLVTSVEIDHSSSLSSVEVDSEPSLAFSVGFPPSEVEEKHQSTMEFEMQTSFGTYLEESRVSNLELGPILEESSEDFIVQEEHMSLVQTTSTFASNGLQILEVPDHSLSSVGQEFVSLHDQSNDKAQDDGDEGKPSETYNLVSANDDMLTGLVIGELVDSMELSNQSKMKSEPEFASNDEHEDMDDDVKEIQVFDEHLLSELDAVGDFQVKELKCRECLHMESQSDGQIVRSEEECELRSAHVAEMSQNKPISANFINLDEMGLVLNTEESRDSGYWSLAMASVEDFTVYNPKLTVLEASSIEELDSIFKQGHPGELVEPPPSETIADKLVAEKPYHELRSYDIVDQEIEAILQEAVLLTLAGKNAEDSSLALLEEGRDLNISASLHDRQNNNLVESVIPSTSGVTSYASTIGEPEASSVELDISSRDIEETDSELLVLEGKYIEDIPSAFKHVTEIVVNKSISPPINAEPMITHPVDTVVEASSPEVEKISGLIVVEAKSAEDKNTAFKQATEENLATSVFLFSDPEPITNHSDLEIIVPSSPDAENSSESLVLEAMPIEDIQSAFKQAIEEDYGMPTSPLIDAVSTKNNQDHEVVEAMHVETRNNTELLVPEEKTYKDIDYACEHADAGPDKPISQFYPVSLANPIDRDVVDVKSLQTQIDQKLLVLDATYVEEVDSSFKPSSEGGLLRSTSLEIDPDHDHDAVEDRSLRANTDFEQLVLEVEYVEETSSTLKQVIEGVFSKSSALVDHEAAGTSEVANMLSFGVENDSDKLPLETKSSQHLNIAFKQDIEADLVQQNLSDLRNFQPDHDAVEERSLDAIDKPELFSLESKSFEDTNSVFNETAADFFGQSSTALIDPGHSPGHQLLDVKSPDSINISDFSLFEAKSLENFDVASRQAIESCLSKAEPIVDVEHNFVDESCLPVGKYSELVVLEEKSTENIQSPFSDAHARVHEGSSSLPVDPELMEARPGREVEENMCFEAENNPEMLVVEAKVIEDINSAFKQATNVATSPLLVDSRSHDIQSASISLVLEANSVELTDSSLKKVNQEVSKKSTFFTDPPPLQANSDNDLERLVLQVNSVEDIDSTFAEVTEGYLDRRPADLQDDSKQTETISESKSVTDSNVVAKQDSEVEYAMKTVAASYEEVTGETSTSEDQINRRKDGGKPGSEDPSSSVPPSMKIKKKKFENSDSSSSSSSSSSDSE